MPARVRSTPSFVSFAVAILATGAAATAQDGVTLSGVKGVRLVDAGIFAVSGGPTTAREETFEFLRRPDGGVTLLSATTMNDGSFRVQARYDYDAAWKAVTAWGQGVYGDEPVQVEMRNTCLLYTSRCV